MARNTNQILTPSSKLSLKAFTLECHVLNDTLSLEFAHVVAVENKEIQVNWTAYAYLVYKKNFHLKVQGKQGMITCLKSKNIHYKHNKMPFL
jgi:hypothetical protein